MKQLTYPAPRRNSTPTGTRLEQRRDWRLVKAKKSEYNVFGLNLVPVEIEVHQRLWTSEPWGLDSGFAAIQSGAWFDNSAEFESKSIKQFIMTAQATMQLLHEEVGHHA